MDSKSKHNAQNAIILKTAYFYGLRILGFKIGVLFLQLHLFQLLHLSSDHLLIIMVSKKKWKYINMF